MSPLAQEMNFYSQQHKKTLTKITHFIGVPLAIFPVLILLSWIDTGVPGWFHINFSWLGLICLITYYFKLDRQLAIATGVGLIILNIIAQLFAQTSPNWLGFKALLITLIIGWAFQFAGHFIEGNKPAFFSNLKQIFIAPIFIAAEIAFLLGKKQALKQEIDLHK